MAGINRAPRRGRPVVALAVAAIFTLALAAPTAAAPGRSDLARVRAATAPFHDTAAAEGAGYEPFYVCTDEPGEGAMGQHFVNLDLVLDPAIDPMRPEALAYVPTNDGFRLGAVEYLVFAEAWDDMHAAPPRLFGHSFGLVPSPNRYGLPPFYELHVWLWQHNPSGMFDEWNPRVSCPA